MAPPPTTGLTDEVLPLIRSRSDLHRWSAANAHGRDMHEAIDILERDEAAGPAERYAVTHKALTSAIKVIARADDSSGIIGDACRRLLELHPRAAAEAQIKPTKLIDWMIKFQFDDNDVDYFELDIAAYSEALGYTGVAAYRNRLADIEAGLGPRPSRAESASTATTVGPTWPTPTRRSTHSRSCRFTSDSSATNSPTPAPSTTAVPPSDWRGCANSHPHPTRPRGSTR